MSDFLGGRGNDPVRKWPTFSIIFRMALSTEAGIFEVHSNPKNKSYGVYDTGWWRAFVSLRTLNGCEEVLQWKE